MDSIMVGREFIELSELDVVPYAAEPEDRVLRGLRRGISAASKLLDAFFDWQWELRLRADERRALASMNARDRADIGLGGPGYDGEASGGFWRG